MLQKCSRDAERADNIAGYNKTSECAVSNRSSAAVIVMRGSLEMGGYYETSECTLSSLHSMGTQSNALYLSI